MSPMKPELEREFAVLAPFLFGESSVEAVEDALGPSASGSTNLDFYRVLVGRNTNKILSELFPVLSALVQREHPGLWKTLVRDYTREHPSNARDANRFGLALSEFLAGRRQASDPPPFSALYEELADYQMCRYLAASAPDEQPGDDGFESRVFIRGYTHPIPTIIARLRADPDAPLPEPQAVTLLIYRSLHPPKRLAWAGIATMTPNLEDIAALAKRQGLALGGPLAQVDEAGLARGLARLVERGVVAAG